MLTAIMIFMYMEKYVILVYFHMKLKNKWNLKAEKLISIVNN